MPIAMAMPIVPGSIINNSVTITIAPDAETTVAQPALRGRGIGGFSGRLDMDICQVLARDWLLFYKFWSYELWNHLSFMAAAQ